MISSTPLSERPRERCLAGGAHLLSLRECIAVLVGTGPPGVGCLGVASRILERAGLGWSDPEEERAFFTSMEGPESLLGIAGLGEAGRARLLAAFELGRRYAIYRGAKNRPSRPLQDLPSTACLALSRVSAALRTEAREWLGFVPVHRDGDTGHLHVIERGARTHVNVDPAELFARVLAVRPQGFILFHNHPSGNAMPSPQDRELTERVADTAAQLGIRLLGHWIVTPTTEQWIVPRGKLR